MTDRTDAEAFREEVFAGEPEDVPNRGQVVTGVVVAITADAVVVNVGLKADGMIPRAEFDELGEFKDLKIGSQIDVKVLSRENSDGTASLSRKEALDEAAVRKIRAAFEAGETVEGEVASEVKGGYRVKLGPALFAFLPSSHASLKRRPKANEVIGKTFPFKIKEFDRARKNIVVSRRVLLEAERGAEREKTLALLAVGEIREGLVKNITTFGVFVDLGGIDGLVTLGDISWSGFVSKPADFVKVGEKIKVKVLEVDLAKDPPRIRLGIKQALGDPWEGVAERHPVGQVIDGPVKTLTPFGAFVEVEPGVDGLVHISEIAWTGHLKHPSEILQIGAIARAKVIAVDPAKRKLSLSVKQAAPDPWSLAFDEYPPGARVHGTVTSLTAFGAFIRLSSGIEGLVHRSEITWESEEADPAKFLEVGKEVDAVVLRIDAAERKIALGIKQTLPDPWQETAMRYARGKTVTGRVLRTTVEGVTVLLEDNLEGFIPLSEVSRVRVFKPEEAGIRVGENVSAIVRRTDRGTRRVLLSIKALERAEEAESRDSGETVPASRAGSFSLGEMLGEKLKNLI